jgi:hypothetical protein
MMLKPFKLNDKNEQEKTVNSANPKPKPSYQTPPTSKVGIKEE